MPLFRFKTQDINEYQLLPTKSPTAAANERRSSPWVSTRFHHKLIAPIVLLSLVYLTLYGPSYDLGFGFGGSSYERVEQPEPEGWSWPASGSDGDHTLPPTYPELKVLESRLPQHNLSLPFPEGANGRYIRLENQMWGVGLNNQLEEVLLFSHLAYLSNRAYVFNNYTWDIIEHGPYVYDRGKLRASVIPLTAFISGPTAGGPWAPGDSAPRSISAEWWNVVCPSEKRLKLNTTVESEKMGLPRLADGEMLIARWAETLKNIDHGCVVIDGYTPSVTDIYFFGSPRIVSLFPSFSTSPVITRFEWSSIVLDAVARNHPLLLPEDSVSPDPKPPVLSGLVAIHLRRGDYDKHCTDVLAATGSEYLGWSLLPFLPERFTPPLGLGHGANSTETMDVYLSHCWPSIEQIKNKLRSVRARDPTLRRVFALTNGEAEWITALKEELVRDGWEGVATTLDLDLTWEQSGVNNAVDMEIGARAQVFIGNGFSSLTSNVNLLRLARGMSPESIRFW
ncbi:hypothetical protein BOTBODRAFT_186403 [Botryobasidium botryosum FD-172 SS1]|uniref:Uncharacterized protein n=1 Tax=Botryobasidium botryosum (strain FD-172 SS1) TaxID=930990 RepID=A0A067MPZ2_BOTB1|nr:hypothetical protein BOTBODRAFT_186403 [Botryobasidium botryosum FD-172 SS1]